MRRLAIITTALLLLFALLLSGCTTGEQLYNNDTLSDEIVYLTPQPELGEYTGPAVSAAEVSVSADYTLKSESLFWPEGASESTADYMLSYELPVFTAPAESCAAMNELLAVYESELIERVVAERMPYADRVEGEDVPATFVICTVSYAASYINITFSESAYFGSLDNKEESFSTLVMDVTGSEANFYRVSGLYAPEDIVAQQIWNIIDREAADSAYHSDVTLEDIKAALDLYNGFIVTDTGYTLFVSPGKLAPEDKGVLSFSFTRAALYPDFVGDIITIEQYERIRPALSALAAACATQYESFSEGSPSAFVATDFMTRMHIASAAYFSTAYATLPKADYESYFSGCFTGALPADISAGDGTYLEGDAYYLPYTLLSKFGLHLDMASVEGDAITLSGMLMYGEPGGLNFGEVAPVLIQLTLDPASPVGCKFLGLSIR